MKTIMSEKFLIQFVSYLNPHSTMQWHYHSFCYLCHLSVGGLLVGHLSSCPKVSPSGCYGSALTCTSSVALTWKGGSVPWRGLGFNVHHNCWTHPHPRYDQSSSYSLLPPCQPPKFFILSTYPVNPPGLLPSNPVWAYLLWQISAYLPAHGSTRRPAACISSASYPSKETDRIEL